MSITVPTEHTVTEPTADVGVIGMAVMGSNLARNFASHGYTVALYNRTPGRTRRPDGRLRQDRVLRPDGERRRASSPASSARGGSS